MPTGHPEDEVEDLRTKWHDAAVAVQQVIPEPDPVEVRRARKRRGLSRADVVAQIAKQPGAHVVTERTIQKIETGKRVDDHRRWPLLVFLGFAEAPSIQRPAQGQTPGAWLRQLREAHGIGPTLFCDHAKYTDSKQRVSRTTLAAIEEDRLFPALKMLDAIAASLKHYALSVDVVDLELAWIHHNPHQAAARWGLTSQQIAEQIKASAQRTPQDRIPGAVAGLRAFAEALKQMDP
jgi:transcriptional regulator with XRE-family HTH domain